MYVAYQAVRGGVSDFMSRLINVQGQTWGNLKAELTARFAEISDHMQAFSLLKKLNKARAKTCNYWLKDSWPWGEMPSTDKTEITWP